MGWIGKIRNPELFQGNLRRRGYFEGWYFKLIDSGLGRAAAVIPGIALGRERHSADSHAFVQFIEGAQAEYFTYPLEAFEADGRAFRVRIGNNAFSRDGLRLDLSGQGRRITGELAFTDALPFPKTPMYPGIMGPFGYIPGMECYHGIVTIRHTIAGALSVGGKEARFDGGTGYIEKDWGRAFPRAWIWLQANHFGDRSAMLFSVADIPWMGGSFRGFFAFLHHRGKMHRFATYTGARLTRLEECGGAVQTAISGRNGRLEISARPGPGGLLRAPKNGLMDRLVEESIAATAEVRLTDAGGRVLFEGESPCAGMERYNAQQLTAPAARNGRPS